MRVPNEDQVIVRAANVAICQAAILIGISVIIGVGGAWAGAHGERSGWAALVLGTAGIAWGARGVRTAVVITSRTIRVRNQLRTYRMSRDDAVGIVVTDRTTGIFPTAMARLVRKDAEQVPLAATTPWKWGATYFTDTTRNWAVDAARERTERIRAAMERTRTAG